MARWLMVLVMVLAVVQNYSADAALVKHTFHVSNFPVRRLCRETVITGVNGQLPGPTIYATEGDTLLIKVINKSPYNITIHWHGVFQRLSNWHDGVEMITQCPIQPGRSYSYKYNVTGQEGTLFWHSHVSSLRATVYGALIILPRPGKGYPFPKPYKEIPILLGEWYNGNVVDMEMNAYLAGTLVVKSDAYTINGRPGDLYPCSSKHTYRLQVEQGKTYLLRVINAAVNSMMFLRVAGHNFTVVAADAVYTEPYSSDILVLAPGQTIDALMTADAPPGRYYMASHVYISNIPRPNPLSLIDSTNTTAIVEYVDSGAPLPQQPLMPALPPFVDTPVANRFYTALKGLVAPGLSPVVPLQVDERMFVTVSMGSLPCEADQIKCNRTAPLRALASSLNNVSFQYPVGVSLLEAHYFGMEGVYTSDFPDRPPAMFNYTDEGNMYNYTLFPTIKATRLKRLRYNATVEMVLQDTALNGPESHPMHLHGFNFFVLAQGYGNYDAEKAAPEFNLVNPHVRNTIAVPVGGWAVIRFVADNPGVWFMHCHFDAHLPKGMALAFEVESGGTPDSTLPPPPPDFPKCHA